MLDKIHKIRFMVREAKISEDICEDQQYKLVILLVVGGASTILAQFM